MHDDCCCVDDDGHYEEDEEDDGGGGGDGDGGGDDRTALDAMCSFYELYVTNTSRLSSALLRSCFGDRPSRTVCRNGS